jgi:hypothetical protein
MGSIIIALSFYADLSTYQEVIVNQIIMALNLDSQLSVRFLGWENADKVCAV